MSTATFLKSDTTTQGTWYKGTSPVYGADGYNVIGYTGGSNPNYPAYATVNNTGNTSGSWAASTTDVRALEYPPAGTSTGSDSNRIAAGWFASSSFTIDIQDGGLHQIALYFLDWDGYGGGRSQQIQITDDNNGNAVLNTQTISNFGSGIWLVWNVSGKVTFTITSENINSNAVISGIFFGPPSVGPFPPFVSQPRFEPAHYE